MVARHPSRTDEGQIAMVVKDYPGRMDIGGRVVKLLSHAYANLADGRTLEQFLVHLYDDSSPHGDRYPAADFKLDSRFLELCNISDASNYCYEHGVEHTFTTTWDIPTPPRFASIEEADAWMEQKALERRVVENARAVQAEQAFNPNVTPMWPCPNDPCEEHGCVGPHADVPAALPPGSYSIQANGFVVGSGDTFTVNVGAITYTVTGRR